MQTKTLTHTAAQFEEAITATIESQVAAEDVLVFVSDFSDTETYELSEGKKGGYYARYFVSV